MEKAVTDDSGRAELQGAGAIAEKADAGKDQQDRRCKFGGKMKSHGAAINAPTAGA